MSANVFAERARAIKAQKIIEACDAAFGAWGLTLPEARLDSVAGMSDGAWACAASVAGVTPPSPETREIVIACYARRVRAAFDAQIAGDIAKVLKAVAP